MEIYKQIRKMRLDGMSQRQIAATLHISRNTVKKYWDGDNVPWERKDYSREASVLTEDVVAFVRNCLNEDAKCKSKKQHHTAKRIYDRLVAECGFTGGETTVRRLVKELREKSREAFVPLAFPAGDAMQIDWGEATVYLDGVKTVVNLFCARLCYSVAPMVLAYRRQNEESFLDALVRVFQYFGGVPKRVIFDNGKVAVKDGFGAHARKQAGYAALAAHYGFEAVFCNPASGNEKGLVEGLVGLVRRNFFVPVPNISTIDELNKKLLEYCAVYRNHKIPGKELTVGEMTENCKDHWIPLPPYRYDTSNTLQIKVDDFSLVRFDHNKYSVPYQYSSKMITVKGSGNQVIMLFRGEIIAKYDRDYRHNQTHYRLEHYIGLIEKRPRSVYNAAPIKETVPTELYQFLMKLSSPKEIVKVLRLYLDTGNVVMKHLPYADSYNTLYAVVIGSSVRKMQIESSIEIVPPDLKRYDSLMKDGDVV